ncbi:MAG: hypothetical protein R2780_01640 [Crocinitomicaceae bacterium]|nr:hypothetical protein [Crocinitomicaceae bacterium]
MKIHFLLPILFVLVACNVSQYRGNNIVTHKSSSLLDKIQGSWDAQKIEYASGYVDKDPRRSFEFDLHGFFEVRFFYQGEYRIKSNLYEVEDDQIKLINKNTNEIFEIVEVVEITNQTFTIQSIFPKESKYTVHMIRS